MPIPGPEVSLILDKNAIIDATRRWTSSVVIGLNLCPFAKRVFQADLIRFVVSDAADSEALRADLDDEMTTLRSAAIETIETTLLVHPDVLGRFDDYCDFLVDAERLLKSRGHRGVLQIAGFHPDYRFADTEPDAAENYTNRSPYPMLHLLREESITKVADNPDDLLDIPKRNAALLRQMGRDALRTLLKTTEANSEKGSHAVQ